MPGCRRVCRETVCGADTDVLNDVKGVLRLQPGRTIVRLSKLLDTRFFGSVCHRVSIEKMRAFLGG